VNRIQCQGGIPVVAIRRTAPNSAYSGLASSESPISFIFSGKIFRVTRTFLQVAESGWVSRLGTSLGQLVDQLVGARRGPPPLARSS